MENSNEEEVTSDEDQDHGDSKAGWIIEAHRSEAEQVEKTPAFSPSGATSTDGVIDFSIDTLTLRHCGGLVCQDLEKHERETEPSDVISDGQGDFIGRERDAPSVSPSSAMETCGPHISSLSSHSPNRSYPNLSSSSASSLCSLTPPLPPTVDLPAVLTDTKLTLDVYQGGAAALPLLWGSVPDQLIGIQYLRLGSEDEPGLDGALEVLPHLAELRSLAIRGNCLLMSICAKMLISADG